MVCFVPKRLNNFQRSQFAPNKLATLTFSLLIVRGRPLLQLRNGESIVGIVRITDRRSKNGKYDGIC